MRLLISSSLLFPYIAGEYFKIKQKNVLLSTFTCNSQFSILEPLIRYSIQHYDTILPYYDT